MKFVMYGAGSIGRGFIGPLFAAAGWEVVFIDINEALVGELNRRRGYRLVIAEEPPREARVTGVRAVDGRDAQAVAEEIASCDLMATSLGAAVLPKVATAVAKGLTLRADRGGGVLDILICENLKHSAQLLKGWLSDALPADRQDLLRRCGLVETAIGRMVPVAEDRDDPLFVTVEAYDYLPVDRAAFLGPIPVIPQLVPHEPFSFYEERKLYLHNMAHAACAYLGLLRGYKYIYEAVADPSIRLIVQSAMEESVQALAGRYGAPVEPLYLHMLDLLHRFGNVRLGDTCERVARDPVRKLGPDDRFAGAVKSCRASGVYPACISVGLAAALLHGTGEEAEARRLLETVCRPEPPDAALAMELYAALRSGGPDAAFRRAETLRRKTIGDII